ncbi:Receptor-like protein kinase THESEUS 1 [Morus notabilis]|uniref:non-specific serine/threonine protein kinase n=1 Tax=Morus notabilis TaxID=981085 RepID=W9SCK3_9ROSA|nr:probable serine/threonine-protein kinase PBL22 [Morus notabilis]EXC35298.1 Receptor-like protein kinase THESEUS 1 [Morus notabilis]
MANGHDRSHGKSHLWGGIVIGILTVFLVATFYYLFKRKILPALRRKTQLPLMKKKGTLKDEKNMLRGFQLEEVVRATKNFSQECFLGSGAFGNVYKGTFDVEGTLAIKRPHNESYQSAQEFMNEVRLLSRVKHRNLVSLVGFCEEPGAKGSKMLVYEYVPNGSLLEYITGKRGRSLNWKQRANIAIGAAKGIAHLHEGIKPSIIHRDIKPSNILVGDGFEAKVSDFGLVKCGPTGDQSHVSSQVKGTPGYLDPDYCSSFHLTPFSDVYSFGVILLQLISARPAIEIAKINSNYHIIEWARPSLEKGKVEDILDVNLLSEPCNMNMMLKMGQLGLRCVVNTPKQRPTMTQVWQELQEALYLADNFINKQPSWDSHKSMDYEYSQSSFVSINGIGFQRFHVEMESHSFQSTVLRCLENNSINYVDIEKSSSKGIHEEKSTKNVC